MVEDNLFKLILGVITDYRVIITTVAMILVIRFAIFVTTYKKKLPKPKGKKKVQKPVAPSPEAKTEKGEENKEGSDTAKTDNKKAANS